MDRLLQHFIPRIVLIFDLYIQLLDAPANAGDLELDPLECKLFAILNTLPDAKNRRE
jgi:hypothetical protein